MRRPPSTIAVWSGKTSAERSRKRSGVSGVVETDTSAPGPGRGALLDERGHSLLRIRGRRVLAHDPLAVLVGSIEAEVDLRIERPLAGGDGQGTRRGDCARQLVRCRLEVFGGHDP